MAAPGGLEASVEAGKGPVKSALLIGSYKCKAGRPLRYHEGAVDGPVHVKSDRKVGHKCNIKPAFIKVGGKTVTRGKDEWAEGDLEIMREFLGKGMPDDKIHTYDYRQSKAGVCALGGADILKEIKWFFEQDNVTHFVLYYTGHGYKDGSWCFSVKTIQSVPTSTGEERSGACVEAVARAEANSVQGESKWTDLVQYDDIIQLWDENKKGRERYLMMILDCCYSGRWVRRVNGEPQDEIGGKIIQKRHDVCIQASCLPNEICGITNTQQCSSFTRAYIDACKRNTFEKLVLSAADHMFVTNFISMWYSRPTGDAFTPLSSEHDTFCGFEFYNSLDEMLFQT